MSRGIHSPDSQQRGAGSARLSFASATSRWHYAGWSDPSETIDAMTDRVIVDGPAWCAPGLDTKGSRFPLRVEAPVMNLVDVLVPGVSTMTSNSRYFSLYWALADYAHDQDFDTLTCRTVLRRAEVALAWASVIDPDTGDLDGPGEMHAPTPYAHDCRRVPSITSSRSATNRIRLARGGATGLSTRDPS